MIKQGKHIYIFDWFDENQNLEVLMIKSYKNVEGEGIKAVHLPFEYVKIGDEAITCPFKYFNNVKGED